MTNTPPLLNAPTPGLIAQFQAIVGERYAIPAGPDQAAYLHEWRELYVGRAALVLLPGSTAEVASILALANQHRIAIVPQGGNTGLVGGQIPFEHGREIVLSLSRINRVRSVDPTATHMTVEAGVTLLEAQQIADRASRLLPLSLASEGSCQIGGVLATNAGGVAVLAYGNARSLALGLEVVLPDGRIIDGLRALKKDNTGYNLRELFIGSEGTLGIITAATLKLWPKPAEQATAFAAVSSVDDVAALFKTAEQLAGQTLTAFEFVNQAGLDMVLTHIPGTQFPLSQRAPWYVLIELSGARPDGSAAHDLEAILTTASATGVITDATLATSLAQAQALWKLRESLSQAQKGAGGSIKHDISVPIASIAEFIARAAVIVERVCPGARPVPFGHFGDGNVHYNVSQPMGMDPAVFLAVWQPMANAIHELVGQLDGSISAEHGIGRLKRADLARTKSAVELDTMRAIKTALDPNGIMNPGKVL